MTDVYKVGVTVTLKNMISQALTMISKDFKTVNNSALAFKRTLSEMKTFGAMSLLGIGGLALMGKAVESANKYNQALMKLQMMGVGDAILSDADKFARGSQIIGASSTDLMNSVRDMTMVLGKSNYGLAQQIAPTMAAMNWANHSLMPDKWDEQQELAMAKVIEMKGGWKSAADFNEQANMMEKVMMGTGGAVKASDYLAFLKTAGVAGRLLSNDTFYYEMEPMIQEMGGNRVGTGLMSAYNNLAQGRSTVRAANEMMKLGLLDPNNVEYDKIGQVKTIHPGALKNFNQFTSDPGQWLMQTLVPLLQKNGFNTKEQMMNEMGVVFGNRTGSALYALMLQQWDKIEKNMATTKGAYGIGEAVNGARQTLPGAMSELAASWDKLKTEAGRALLPVVIPAINSLSGALRELGGMMQRHPIRTEYLMKAFGVLSVGLAAAFPVELMVKLAPLLLAVGRGIFMFAGNLMLAGRMGTMLWASTSTLLPRLGALALAFNPVTLAVVGVGTALALTLPPLKTWKAALDELPGAFHALDGACEWLIQTIKHPFGGDDKLGHMRGNIGTPPGGTRTVQVHSQVNLDGRAVAKTVTEHQVRSMNGPSSGYSGSDSRQSYSPVPVGGN